LDGIPVHVIPSGIDFDLFRPIPQPEARAKLRLSPDDRYVLFIGSPEIARKRFALAEQAVAIVARTMPVKMLLGWTVPHSEMPYYIAAADALVFTSASEG